MSAEPFVYNVVLDRVIDGDTIKVSSIDLGFSVSLQNRSIRIAQIDTPESRINLKKYPERTKEKELGLLAKAKLKEWLVGNITIKSFGPDKYGRILADVFCKKGNIADLLKNHEPPLAVDYDGGKKTKVWS
tara:strand:- start:12 stop:404 length:393 start_codon:yes stop_codon:yes gene_type:complete